MHDRLDTPLNKTDAGNSESSRARPFKVTQKRKTYKLQSDVALLLSFPCDTE